MIEVAPLSPENELPVAERLRQLVLAEWPDLAATPATDRVRIFVGVHVGGEIDLLVEIALASERPVAACRMRDGSFAPAASIVGGLLAIEVKQHDRECFEIDGTEIFPVYGRKPSSRSVAAQVCDGVVAVKAFLRKYVDENVFVHALGWLTDMPESELGAVPAYIVGRETTWSSLLQAAATQSRVLFDGTPAEYQRAIETLGSVLINRRRVPPPDRAAVDRLTGATIANGKFEEVRLALGHRQIRLAGRAGSGKSTTLALLADYVARIRQERVLVLTYHHALCREIDRLIRSVVGDDALVDRHVRIATLVDFLAEACIELGAEVPRTDGKVDYTRIDEAFQTFLDSQSIEALRKDAETLKDLEPERYAFDYVCIDEAQDCRDAERDLLRRLYPPERIVLADGLDQLIRRNTPCDWTTGIKPADRLHVELSRSLRMSRNLAAFATAMAAAMDLNGWRIVSHDDLSGGRVIVLPHGYDRAIFAELTASLDDSRNARKDLLVCVPPSEAVRGRTVDSRVAVSLRSWGYRVWNGCDAETRENDVADTDEIRVVQYHSMRGLEGWYTMLVDLDDSYAHRLAHPNIRPDNRRTPESVAASWLLMALTRAAATLVITLRDPASVVGDWLRAATTALPAGIVEWRDTP